MPTVTTPDIEGAAKAAKEASRTLASLPTEPKNAVLLDLAAAIEAETPRVLAANAEDMRASEAAGLTSAKLRRLVLDEKKIAGMCEGLRQIAGLPDPVNGVSKEHQVPSGLTVRKVRTPLGVIAMIYEARPNVTIDAFALCFKAGNACILKGGREANESNHALAGVAREVLGKHGLPEAAITCLTTSDREEIKRMLQLEGLIDLVIPRGGETLIRFVHEHSRIPTVQHFHGVCHVYVDQAADPQMAAKIAATAKTSAPATCNAAECVLVHASAPDAFYTPFVKACDEGGVELRVDEAFAAKLQSLGLTPARCAPATDADWGHEYLDEIMAAKVVGSIDEAIGHIARFGSDHTDTIVTGDDAAADRFCREVTSSCVLVNASTRFNDGFQLGLGAEIGISTSKIHAYGPMGLEELTTERYVVLGSGQTR